MPHIRVSCFLDTALSSYEGGERVDLVPGKAFHITSTPHDSWVEGNEPYVSLHVLG
jgi:hypothetical protein